MCSNHQYGEAKSVLNFDKVSESIANHAALDEIFDHPDVKNCKIVIFSGIGAFRKGKSFLLDYCLRYLYANCKSINYPDNPLNNSANWMGNEKDPLQGFSWRSGSYRDTTGINMWSDVFLHTVPSTGEKIAIIIMDTESFFDNETSSKGNARIFSLEFFNLMNVLIQEDQLEYLDIATELVRFVSDASNNQSGKSFQNLKFLIRDWENEDEHEMDEEFKDELKVLIEKLLNPDILVLKKINGKELIGSEMKYYIDHYLKLFQSDNLPPALTIYESTVEKQISLIVTECFDNYKETIFKNQGLITTEDQIPIFHEMSRNKALVMYKEKKKQLEGYMDKAFSDWSDQSASSIKQIGEEREKTRLAIEEKDRLFREQLAAEKEAAVKIAELEKLNAENNIEQERFEHEKKLAEMKLQTQKERFAREKLESEKQAAEKIAELEKLNAENALEQERIEKKIYFNYVIKALIGFLESTNNFNVDYNMVDMIPKNKEVKSVYPELQALPVYFIDESNKPINSIKDSRFQKHEKSWNDLNSYEKSRIKASKVNYQGRIITFETFACNNEEIFKVLTDSEIATLLDGKEFCIGEDIKPEDEHFMKRKFKRIHL